MGEIAALGAQLVGLVCDVYSVIVLAGVFTSWIRLRPDHPFAHLLHRTTEPVYARMRRIVPTTFGGFDIAPLFLLVLVQLVRAALQRLLLGLV